MPPAARIGDMHVCPMVNPGPVPHVGGPEVSGSPDVIVGFMPQGRVGDTLICVPATDSIAMGSPTVLVNNKPAARLGDPTVHGGKLVAGCPTVIIGDSGQGATLAAAAASGKPFCEECEKAKAKAEAEAKARKELEKPPPPNATPPDAATTAPPPVSPEVTQALADAYAKGAIAKPEIDALSDGVAAQIPDSRVAKAPLKGEKRVLEKALDYAKEDLRSVIEPQDVARLKDIVRNTIVVPHGKEAEALALLREAAPNIPDKAVKIVAAAADPCGYSGMNIAVPSSTGMVCEVQINSPHMIYAKEKPEDARRILGPEVYDALASKPGMPVGGQGHTLYEEYRVLGVADPKKAEIAAKSTAYYDSVRKAAGVI